MNDFLKIYRCTWILLLAVALTAGCGRSQPKPVADSTQPPETPLDSSAAANAGSVADETEASGSTNQDEADATNGDAATKTASTTPPTDSEPDPKPESTDEGVAGETSVLEEDTVPVTGDVAQVGTDAPEQTGTVAPPTERFALLTAGGPLVVDVIITIDGDAHNAALEELVDEAYQAADTDGDGKRTWEEVANSPKFMYGQFGNLEVTDDQQKRQLITMYDRNEDGLVDRGELPRFVTRNVGRAQSFSLTTSNEFRSDNRSRSPFRRLLDADHNGAITQEEMIASPARLLSRDADDDQIITLADFKDNVQAMPGQMSSRRRTSEPDTAILINDRTKWGYAAYSLQELYSFGDPVGISDWPLTPGLFKALDVDGDEQLGRKEVENLATVKPHLRLRAGFGLKNAEDGQRKTTLTLDFVDPSIEEAVAAIRTHERRVSIELSRVEVEFFVNEDPSLSNYEEVAKTQFNTFDTDGNGYLGESELPDQPGLNLPFAGVDEDGDGKVYLEELTRFLELRQRAYRGQVRARAADQEDALFTALDTSGDGRLHAREIAATAERLAQMDLNADGVLQSHEIPGSMVVGFVRGNPQQDNTLFVMPTGMGGDTGQPLPRWFVGMDTNRDGEVGQHEFLGTAERFASFDKDGDGFINPTEIPSEMRPSQPEETAPKDAAESAES